MTTYQYIGNDERVFPTLGVTVNSGDTFDAIDGLTVVDVVVATAKKSTAPAVASTPSDDSDITAKEVK